MTNGGNAQLDQPGKPQNEIVWSLGRFFLLLKYWTTPLNTPVIVSPEDQTSVRAFALFIIVALTFAIRADASTGTYAGYAAMASAIAVVMSVTLNTLSEQFNVQIREQLLISAYASTICVMFLYIFVEAFFSGTQIYEIPAFYLGTVVTSTIFASVFSYCLLILKAVAVDRRHPNKLGLLHAAGLIAGSSLIVLCIAVLSDPVFKWLVERLRQITT